MLANLLENDPSIRKVVNKLVGCKKIILSLGNETRGAQLQKELERLALTAPHMLADIGFKRDPNACSGEKEVWRRGTHSVIIFGSKHAVAFV